MEEKLRILKMVEEGKLTAEQAVELLKALEGTAPEQETTDSAESFYEETRAVPENIPYENKMLRIIVDSSAGDKVNIQLPVKIIRQMLMVTGKLPIKRRNWKGLTWKNLRHPFLNVLTMKHLET